MKTSELTGAALDWAVAKCENFYTDGFSIIRLWNNLVTKIIPGDYETREVYTSYSPSTDWSQGGPIIDRERIGFLWEHYDNELVCVARVHTPPQGEIVAEGPTPLTAAMRCYVSSRLGDEVDVPEELSR